MANNIRTQTLPGTAPFLDGSNGGNVSIGRSTLFGKLYMFIPNSTPKEVGGMQAFSVSETNGTQFRYMAGSDWLEPVFGPRMWQGSFSRFQVRGADFQELLYREYDNLGDIDFRFTPFIWQYGFNYQSPNGQKTIESAQWNWMTVWITTYTTSFADPFSQIMEDGQFIGKGFHRSDGNGLYSIKSNPVLWGDGGFAGGGQTVAKAPATAPSSIVGSGLAATSLPGITGGLGSGSDALGGNGPKGS